MSSFTGYEKMGDSPDRWKLDPAAYRRLARGRWIVTEKIHGANFCFVIDNRGEIRGANRRVLLAEGDAFFGWQAVRERLRPALLATFNSACRDLPGLRRLYVFGELFGGGYPHPEVDAVPNVQPVQTGVWYAPGIEFIAFDLAVESTTEKRSYQDYEAAMRLWDTAGLPYATPLFTGSYTDALAFPLGFDSTVPRRLGLPPLPVGTNKAEGVVVKPLREIVLETPTGPVRPILKRKIAEFAEDDRYAGATKWEAPVDAANAYRLDTLKWEATARLNINRLAAAVSKIGYREGLRAPSRASLLFSLIASEVWDELAEETISLTSAEQSTLRTHIAQGTRELLRQLDRPI